MVEGNARGTRLQRGNSGCEKRNVENFVGGEVASKIAEQPSPPPPRVSWVRRDRRGDSLSGESHAPPSGGPQVALAPRAFSCGKQRWENPSVCLVAGEAPAATPPVLHLGSAPGPNLDASSGPNFWGSERHGDGGLGVEGAEGSAPPPLCPTVCSHSTQN